VKTFGRKGRFRPRHAGSNPRIREVGLGLLWEGRILFLDFSFPNCNNFTDKDLRRFFQEIEGLVQKPAFWGNRRWGVRVSV